MPTCTLFPLAPRSVIPTQRREQPAASITGHPRGRRSVGKALPGAHGTLRRLGGGRCRPLLLGDPEWVHHGGPWVKPHFFMAMQVMVIVCSHLGCEPGRDSL